MSTKPLTLQEASKRVEDWNPSEEFDPEVLQFLESIEVSGKEILEAKSPNGVGKYVGDAADLLLACALTETISGEMDSTDLQAAMFLSSNMEVAKLILGYAFVYAVGLCATEELR